MNSCQNLLPDSCRRKLLMKSRLRLWCGVWALVSIVCGIAGAAQYAALRQTQRELARLETEAAPLHDLRRQTAKSQQQLAALSSRESMLHALEKAGHPLKLLGIVSQSAAVNTGKLRITDLEMETTSVPAPVVQANQPVAEPPRKYVDLRLTGVSSDNLSVARFVDVIRSFRVFDNVNLQSTDDDATQELQDFQLNCKYEE